MRPANFLSVSFAGFITPIEVKAKSLTLFPYARHISSQISNIASVDEALGGQLFQSAQR
jgi:hypothetical protein